MSEFVYKCTENAIHRLSFPDAQVANPVIDWERRELDFVVSSAFIEDLNNPRLGQLKVRIQGWDSMKMSTYNHVNASWKDADDILQNFPKDICEFEPFESGMNLRGFGRSTGCWTELKIAGNSTCIRLTQLPSK